MEKQTYKKSGKIIKQDFKCPKCKQQLFLNILGFWACPDCGYDHLCQERL